MAPVLLPDRRSPAICTGFTRPSLFALDVARALSGLWSFWLVLWQAIAYYTDQI
jgi:hypothetical protein